MLLDPLYLHARQTPNKLACTCERGSVTFGELLKKARRLAKVIRDSTDAPAVGILLPSGTAFVTAFYASLLAGKVVVPINFLLGKRETHHVLADSGVDTVVTADLMLKKFDAGQAVAESSARVLDLSALKPTLAGVLRQLLPLPEVRHDARSLAVIMYTSGTSGLPKGVELTFGALHQTIEGAIKLARITGEHSFLGVVPLFHSFGMVASMLAPIRLGSAVFYQARFNPAAVATLVKEKQISLVFMVPSMYRALTHMKSVDADTFSKSWVVISGGEPLPRNVAEAFEARFGLPLREGYGLTETCGPIALNVPWAKRIGSVGMLLPNARVKIAGEQGQDLTTTGEQGEILLGGPTILRAYHNLPDVTEQAISNGFFHSGDLGHVDADGFLFITGRRKEMISVAGEKVSPREIEDILTAHADVAEAAVVGKPDESRGEVVAAFVVAKPGRTLSTGDLSAWCKSQGLPAWKCPREINVLDALPTSPTGKVLKRELTQMLASPGA